MATGLKLPISVNTSGGMALSTDVENDNKIIKTGLSDDDNENAFQQGIGLGDKMIFEVNRPELRVTIANDVRLIFERFEAQNRYKLLPSTLKWTENSQDQTLVLEFRYVNLETDEVQDFSRTFEAGE